MSLSPRQLRQRFELLSIIHAFGGGKTSYSYERLASFLSTAPPSFGVSLDKLFGTQSVNATERLARLWGTHDRMSTPTVQDLLEALTLGSVPNFALSSLASPSPPRRALRTTTPPQVLPPPLPQVMPVRFTFVAENPGELGVERGEAVEVISEGVEDVPPGWALVTRVGGGGERGFVPVDFLGAIGEEVATATPEKEMAAAASIPARVEEEGGGEEDTDTVPLSSFAFLAHEFICEGPGEISVPQGELVQVEPPPKPYEEQWPAGWTFVAFAVTKGFVPTSFLIPALSTGLDAATAAATGTAEEGAPSMSDAPSTLEAVESTAAPTPPSAPILPPLPTTTAAPTSSRSSSTTAPAPAAPPSAMTLPLQAPSTASSYAQGYLDAMSRVLLEARLALKEAEIQGATSHTTSYSISSSSNSSSFSSRTTYLASESRPATALSLPTFPSLRSSRVGGSSKGGVHESSSGGGGGGAPPGVSAVIQWAAASGKDLLSATTASLAAHVALVGQLEGEAFKAYTLVQEGKAVGEEGRRKAPPPPPPA